jgi:subtilisin family serine protease
MPGEVLVKFKSPAAARIAPAAAALAGARVKHRFTQLGWELIALPPTLTVPEALALYRAQAEVAFAEPNYRYELDPPLRGAGRDAFHRVPPLKSRSGDAVARVPTGVGSVTPNDPRFGDLWGLEKIGAPQAWQRTTGGGVVVGVVDTGIDYRHPDLAANVWSNPGEIPGNAKDDDHNGFVDDVHGIDLVEGDGDPLDDDGHGTHVSGTIGAVGNNGVGVAGVNWTVQIVMVRIFSADHFATAADIVKGYEYLTALKQQGVNLRVINNSWGGPYPSRAMKDAVCAAGDADILSVCAAGNDHVDNDFAPHFPSSYDCDALIGVAASTPEDEPASFTNYGASTVHLAAPGVGTLSTYKGGPIYAAEQGTSMACPHVAGAAALLLAKKPSLTALEVKSLLLETVDQFPQWQGKVTTSGRLNVGKAMHRLTSGGIQGEAAKPASAGDWPAPPTSDNVGPEQAPGISRGLTLVSRTSAGRLANGVSAVPAISDDGRFVAFVSNATNLAPSQGEAHFQVFLHDRQTGTTTRVSENVAGAEGNADSDAPAISADGRFVVFHSDATNLVAGDSNGVRDVFLYDRMNRTLELFSRRANGGLANGPSENAVISADGNVIAYASLASNIVGGDSNGSKDVFVQVRTRATAPVRASVGNRGVQGDSASDAPSLSAEGRFVAFHSGASNFSPTDFVDTFDVFVRDLTAGQTELVSVNQAGAPGEGDSGFPSISGDGRYVIFESPAANLANADTNEAWDIFLRDRQAGSTARVSLANDGRQADKACFRSAISRDGRHIIFESEATTLAPGQPEDVGRLFAFDRLPRKLSRLPHNARGIPANDACYFPSLSADGRYVAFMSWAFNLVPGDGNAVADVFVLDRGSSRPDLMIRAPGQTQFAGTGLYGPNLAQRSAQPVQAGATVAYELKLENSGTLTEAFIVTAQGAPAGWQEEFFDATAGGNRVTAAVTGAGWVTPTLAPGSSAWLRLEVTRAAERIGPGTLEVLVRVRATSDATPLDSVRAVTSGPFSPPDLIAISRASDGTPGTETSRGPALSGDGRFVAFTSDADNLAPRDYNRDKDVFLWDRATDGVELLSKTGEGVPGDFRSENVSISRDGRFVAYQSRTTNFVTGDLNFREDIFVQDRQTGQITRASVATGGAEANRGSEFGKLSGNGQVVVFQSVATNLTPNDQNNSWDVFRHERATGQTRCVSLTPGGRTGDGDSTFPLVSGDGQVVVFESYASDLAPNDDNHDKDVFLYDAQSGALELLSRAPDGHAANGPSEGPWISDDGRWVLFSSEADNLAPPPAAGELDVGYLYDRTARTLARVTVRSAGLPAEASFSAIAISSDGRWITLNSSSPGVMPGVVGRSNQAFLLDRQTGTLTPLSVTRDGFGGASDSFGGVLSADGRYIAFRSFASNLLGETAPEASQVFVWDRARFQPDGLVRRDGNAPARGGDVFAPTPQAVEQTVSPGGSRTFFVAIRNHGEFEETFLVTGTAGEPGAWELEYFADDTGEDVTAMVAGPGWRPGSFPGGVGRVLRIVVRQLSPQPAPKMISVHAVSVSDPFRSDTVVAIAQPDNDTDTLPDTWERALFNSTTVATVTSDFDLDGVSDAAEFLAGTDPKDERSFLAITSVSAVAGPIVIHWASAPNRFYAVERAFDLSGRFSVLAENLAATPPQNVFADPVTAEGRVRFYRIRAELP